MGKKFFLSLVIMLGMLAIPAFVMAEGEEESESEPAQSEEENEEVQQDATDNSFALNHSFATQARALLQVPEVLARFTNQPSYQFEYPEDGVRGIYVTAHSAGGARFDSLVDLINTTDLNSMVIDIKEDHGYLTYHPEADSDYTDIAKNYISDIEGLMERLEEEEIYPIARIVVFKDSVLAENKPEWSFMDGNKVWKNNRNEAFVNPFLEEVWEYNVDIAEKAAKLGFKEIQFDYVRFPEGFERMFDQLDYDGGDYWSGEGDDTEKRVAAVTDFVAYARDRLASYDVDVSVDIFGYAATISEAPGIGQNFSKISENVDVISSMIYPSHWTPYFGIDKPDTQPYELTKAYAEVENEVLGALDEPPVSRPWIQDFTASWLGAGNYIPYGVEEVEAQIRALNEAGIEEFLLWNAGNTYTKGVDYKP
ncbi:putative glycoside hydrolase [Alkalihalobacillus pseudalcaliphilus]|uniref:putative glycoside hydrolase n=1 Tax=Alkalihalobacillus pseudalcaliphilus TaxID=79884 RepID=UPI00064DBC05|nr:putative glycoside hydrolase [Alkalihalobacillus pseudalcaliphilus]KMK74831.1 GTP-binding protein [Alkalihalobacillus pseudalcaliphilus]